ncbi:unnamed protein product, partial [Polarella glacialis]
DVGSGIRFKAAAILEMCADQELLMEERQKAQKLTEKLGLQGVVGAEMPVTKERSGGTSAFKSPFGGRQKDWKGRKKAGKEDESSPSSSPPGYSPGGRPPSSEMEANTLIQQFISVTNASRLSAKDSLERHDWDVQAAVAQYLHENRGEGFGNSRSDKPGWTEQKTRADQLIQIAKVTEREAQDLLERSGWHVEAALEKFYAEQPSSPPARSTNSRPAPTPAPRRDQSPSSGSGSS